VSDQNFAHHINFGCLRTWWRAPALETWGET